MRPSPNPVTRVAIKTAPLKERVMLTGSRPSSVLRKYEKNAMAIPVLDKHMAKSVCRLKLEKMPSRDIDVAVRLAEIRKIQVIILNIDNIIFWGMAT